MLLSPLRFTIDSNHGIASVGWNKWMNAKVSREDENWSLRLRLPFWTKQWHVEELIREAGRKRLDPLVKAPSKKGSHSKWTWARFKRIMRQFRIREFKLILDTDDFILNAYLTPVFEIISGLTRWRMRINFNGRNELKFSGDIRIFNALVAGAF